jgi:hypothetical protein
MTARAVSRNKNRRLGRSVDNWSQGPLMTTAVSGKVA